MLKRVMPYLTDKRVNLFPAVFVGWSVAIYLLILVGLPWYLWIVVGLLFVERMLLQLAMWLAKQVLKQMQMRIMEDLAKSMTDMDGPMGMVPPDDIDPLGG